MISVHRKGSFQIILHCKCHRKKNFPCSFTCPSSPVKGGCRVSCYLHMNLLNTFFFSQFSVCQQLCCHFSSWILPSDITSCTSLFRNWPFGQQTKAIHSFVCPALSAFQLVWAVAPSAVPQSQVEPGHLQGSSAVLHLWETPRILAMHQGASPSGWAPCKAPGRAAALSGGQIQVSPSALPGPPGHLLSDLHLFHVS